MVATPAPSRMAAPTPRPTYPKWTLTRRVEFAGFGALLVLAVVFYLWWGLTFGVWLDNGVYAVVVTLALFGLAGMWLVTPEPMEPTPAPTT